MVDQAREAAPTGAGEQRGAVRKTVLEIAGDVPRIVDDPIAIGDDRDEMLPAQRADCLDIGKAHMTELGLDALMRHRVADAPRERTWPPSIRADALVHDEGHEVLCPRRSSRV
jgi:hypothetical protein